MENLSFMLDSIPGETYTSTIELDQPYTFESCVPSNDLKVITKIDVQSGDNLIITSYGMLLYILTETSSGPLFLIPCLSYYSPITITEVSSSPTVITYHYKLLTQELYDILKDKRLNVVNKINKKLVLDVYKDGVISRPYMC